MTGAILAAIGLFLGGILKGATGAGAPIIGVPVMAIWFGVPVAVAVFSVPNLLANIWQAWAYRKDRLPPRFSIGFMAGGAAGTLAGTFLLTSLPPAALTLAVAIAVFAYVGFRFARPGWVLSYPLGEKLAWLIGPLGGTLFGATGLSAPLTLSFLNAMRLERRTFIATVSGFFTATGVVQLPALYGFGLLNWELLIYGVGALALILAGMPAGAWLGKRISREVFDKVVLALLSIIAIRLVISAF